MHVGYTGEGSSIPLQPLAVARFTFPDFCLPLLIAFLLTADAKVCHNCHAPLAPPTDTPTSLIKRI